MRKLFFELLYGKFDNQRKRAYQLHFKNGEVIKLDGYSTYSNQISRTSSLIAILFLAPFQIVKNNVIYFTLSVISLIIISSLWTLDSLQFEFYFIITFQYIAHLLVEFFNKFNLSKLDRKLNCQEVKLLKQWDECISNKEILKRIKEKANQKPKIEELKERDRKPSSAKNEQHALLLRQLSQKSRSSGMQSQMSRQSVALGPQNRPAQSPNPHSDKLDRMGSRVSLMSPLIHEDMIIKNELKQKLIQDPAISKFMGQVPSMFDRVNMRSKKIIDTKTMKNADKMDLIKSITSQEIQLGDVIIIDRNQIAQCDILVLHCNDENFTVQQQLCCYSGVSIRKPLNQNRYDSHNLVLFKKSFTGSIQLTEQPEIKGYFQLKKDPQSKIITEENILFASEKLLNTPWVIGVVIKVGLKCRCYSKLQIKYQQPNYSQKLLSIIVCIFFSLLILMYIVVYQNQYVQKYRNLIEIIVKNLMQLLFILPHSFRLYYSVLSLFQQKILTRIGEIDIKQIRAFHLEEYNNAKQITMNLDSLIDGTFELRTIICKTRICYCKETDFVKQASILAPQSSHNIFRTADSRDDSKITEIQKQNLISNTSRYVEEVGSIDDDDESAGIVPQSNGFRLISNFNFANENNDNTQPDAVNLISHGQIGVQSETLGKTKIQYSKSSKQYSMKDSKIERKSIFVNDLIKLINGDDDIFNPTLLQFCLNQVSYSKLMYTQTGEEKVKNTHMNQLDDKQIQIAKSFGYEFVCVNNVQNSLIYIVQIGFKLFNFKLVDTQLHHHSQRLYMLFELDPEFISTQNNQFILFIRESNYKKAELYDEKLSQKSSLHIVHQVEFESIHQIHYYSCLLNAEDAAFYINQQSLQQSSIENEQFMYHTLEPLLQLNIVLGFKYVFRPKAQEFLNNIEKSKHQLLLYTEQYFSFSMSIISSTDISHHAKFVFEQDNDDDLRAYFKKTLQQVSQIQLDQSLTTDSKNSFSKLAIPNPSQLSNTKKIYEEYHAPTPITVVLNSSTCKIIENHSYMKNHLKLIFRLAKTIVLFNADQVSLDLVQNLLDQPQQSLNLIFENQSILRCYQGRHLQIALLQEFSYFQKVKYENVNKQTFFKNMIASLKVRLIYERCIFNELLIFHNSDAILQSFHEVNELLFYYTPVMTVLSRQTLEIAFQRTIFFAAFCIIIHMVNLQTSVDELDLTFELGFFSYIYSLLIYVISTLHFVHPNKVNQSDNQQTMIIKAITNQNKDKELYFLLAFKSIFQGVITALIFSYNDPVIQYEVIIVYTFLSIVLYDALNYSSLVRIKLKIWSIISFSLLYFFYLLLHFNVTVQNTYFEFQVDLLFEIFLVLAMLYTSDSIMHRPFIENLPKMDSKLNQLYGQLLGEKSSLSQKSFSALSKHVNKIFDNIEQVDISIQKLLLNQKILSQNLGQWQSQIFQKAQSIMKWKKKSTIQGLQLIFFHCQMLIIIYVLSDNNYYFLIIYIIYSIFQIFLFVFQQISKLSSKQMQYLELVKFMTSGLATLMALLGLLMNGMSTSYNSFTQILVVFQVSSKLHPIYDNRLYLIPIVVVLIVYFIIIAITVEVTPYFMIIMIAMIFLFSVQQYIIKSYFILLEENQATNQINFIEENNKINDILGILLPKFVRHRLNETDEYNIHQNQGHVAIVFCDICNFDQIIMEEQKNIIQFLDDLFRTFDKYCEICGVQKIETVGKTYMASAGLKACEQDLAYLSEIHPVQRALNLAEMMINYIRTKLWGNEGKMLIGKIGIHYGRAISGVIGFHKPQFSLIGDTVNTTSRVCSTGLEDKIILSEQAFEQLNNDKIEFTTRYVEMKGLGQRPTYIYVQKIGDTKASIVHRTSLSGSNGGSRQNTITYQNRIRTSSQQKGGLKKRQSFIQQQSLKQITTSQLQFQTSFSQHQKLISASTNPDQSASKPNTIQFSQQIQQIMRKESMENQNIEQAKKPDLLKKLATILQHKFQLEEYQPEVDHYIDYDQLLNVILLKNENKFEDTLILESSFIQLLKKSYSQNQNKYLEYHDFIYNQSEVVTNKIMQVYTLYYLIKQFCLIGEYNSIPLPLIILQWIGCAQNIISVMIYNRKFLNYWIFIIQIELSYQLLIGGLFQIMDISEFLTNIHLIEMIFIQSFFSNIQLLHFWIKIVFCVCSFIFELFILAFAEDYRISIFFVLMIFVYNVNYCYFLEEQQVSCFNQKNVFQIQQAKESQLLQYLLPKHILQTFFDDNNRTSQQCDEIENITILFADIAGFTEYSSKVSAEQVLLMLKNLFVEFDRQCYELNVYKLYTIGDCYVAFGMIDYNDRNPSEEAKNIVDLAFEMIRIIEIVRKQINFEGLDMRIGIHTGSVFGGVMGTDIVRYDIYGPDVLIANKMESNGKKGCVQVSAKTKALLEQDYEDKYDFTLHTKVTLQTINQSIEGFLVEKLADDDFQSDQVMSQAIQVQSLHSD